jgi:hypothetical protein
MDPVQKTANTERDRRAQQAAYLRAQHNYSQEEIGRILGGVSQSHVSRLLAHAAEAGWLVTEMRFDDSSVSSEVMRELRELLEPRKLVAVLERIRETTGRVVPNIRVFDSGSDSPTAGALELRLRRFGRRASGRLEELLRHSSIVAVTWGRTVASLIDGLAAQNRTFHSERPPLFVPVTAELVTLAAPDYSSSLLAARLDVLVNGGRGERLRMAGVPAFIPKRYDAAKTRAIREYILDTASYRRIFGGQAPLVNMLDMVVTSAGSASRPLGGALDEVLSAAELSAADLTRLIVGDIGGVLIPRRDLPPEDLRLVEELNVMWTGITKGHLGRLALRAGDRTGAAGVVVAAVGRERAEIVAGLIELEMVNELIIDWDLAEALEGLFL